MNAAGTPLIEVDSGNFNILENAFDEVANTFDSQVVVPELIAKASFRKNVKIKTRNWELTRCNTSRLVFAFSPSPNARAPASPTLL